MFQSIFSASLIVLVIFLGYVGMRLINFVVAKIYLITIGFAFVLNILQFLFQNELDILSVIIAIVWLVLYIYNARFFYQRDIRCVEIFRSCKNSIVTPLIINNIYEIKDEEKAYYINELNKLNTKNYKREKFNYGFIEYKEGEGILMKMIFRSFADEEVFINAINENITLLSEEKERNGVSVELLINSIIAK